MNPCGLDGWIFERLAAGGFESLPAWQLAKLQQTLAHAKKAPFWREKLAAAPEVRALADLRRLPFTTPAELAARGAEMVCAAGGDISRVVTLQTSGTTGGAKRLWFTEEDQELTRDFFHRGMRGFTQPGDRALILLPGETPGSVGHLLAGALRRIPAVPLPFGAVTAQNAPAARRLLLEERVNVVVGVPHQLLLLAEGEGAAAVKRQGALRAALYATDYLPPPLAGRVEAALGCRGYEHYGMTEMGLGGGVSCGAQGGYHLREADLLFEIVNPATGAPLPDGEEGELVFTTLTRRGMPLVRYRTGDLAAFSPHACPCGARLRTLRKTRGRAGQTLRLPGGGAVSLAQLDDRLFAARGLLDYSVSLQRENGGDVLAVHYTGGASEVEMRALLQKTPLGEALDAGLLKMAFRPGFAREQDAKAVRKRSIGG